MDSLFCLLQKVWSRWEYDRFYRPFLGTAPWWPLSRGTCPGNSEESEGNPRLDSNTWLTIFLIQVVEIQCRGCVDCYTLAANFIRVLKCLSRVLQTLISKTDGNQYVLLKFLIFLKHFFSLCSCMQSLWHVSREAHLISTRCMDLASFHRSFGLALYLYLKCCMNLFLLPKFFCWKR